MSQMSEKSRGNIAEFIVQEFIKAVSSWVKWVIEFKRLSVEMKMVNLWLGHKIDQMF